MEPAAESINGRLWSGRVEPQARFSAARRGSAQAPSGTSRDGMMPASRFARGQSGSTESDTAQRPTASPSSARPAASARARGGGSSAPPRSRRRSRLGFAPTSRRWRWNTSRHNSEPSRTKRDERGRIARRLPRTEPDQDKSQQRIQTVKTCNDPCAQIRRSPTGSGSRNWIFARGETNRID